MAEFFNANPTLAMLIFLFAFMVAMIVCVMLLNKGGERRQARLMRGLRHENELQGQSILQLSENLQTAMRQIENYSAAMEARQDRLRRTVDERMEAMIQNNDHKLEQMREIVSEKLDGRLRESFKAVNGQLESVHRGLGEMRELSMGVADLRKMLSGVKTRGVWGEAQLRGIMAQMFAPGQYVENAEIPVGSAMRVEFALRIPASGENDALLPIDSKFPQEDYLRLMEAAASGDSTRVQKCALLLERAVLEQAKMIHDKYIRPPQTTDFAVMFLPVESLYAEIARRNGLIEKIQDKYRVMIAGPATLCALLTSLQMGFRSVNLEKRSGEVLKLLAEMKQDFVRFDESLRRLRQRLNQAETELDAVESRTRKIGRTLSSVEEEN